MLRPLVAMMRCLPQNVAKPSSLAKPTSSCRKVRKANFGKHHSKNAPLSVDKSAFFVGGGEGSRTPVRKHLDMTFFGCITSLTFPQGSPTHRRRLSVVLSFMVGSRANCRRTFIASSRPSRSRDTLRADGPSSDGSTANFTPYGVKLSSHCNRIVVVYF